MNALDFLHSLSLPNADVVGLAKKLQDHLDNLTKAAQDKEQNNYVLRKQIEQLEEKRSELLREKLILTNNLESVTKTNRRLESENKELTELSNNLNDTILKNHEEIKELKEARDALAAAKQEKEIQEILAEANKVKIFYKNQNDPDWTQIVPGQSVGDFKSASTIRESGQPLERDFETIIIDDPQYTSHSVRKLETKTKEELIKLCTRQAYNLKILNEKWVQTKKSYQELNSKYYKRIELDQERQKEISTLSEYAHKLETQNIELKKAHQSDCKNYTKQIESLEENKTLITSLYNNQVNTIKAQTQIINQVKHLLNNIDEVISESDA